MTPTRERRKPPVPPPRNNSIPKNMWELTDKPPVSAKVHRRRRSDSALTPSESVKVMMKKNYRKKDVTQSSDNESYKVDSNENEKRRSIGSSLSDLSVDSDGALDRVETWGKSFEKFLADPVGLRNFQEFLKKEFSEENIQFYLAVEKFKLIQDAERMVERSNEIFNNFLCPGAPLLVNVNQAAYDCAEEAMKNACPDMFNESQKQVYQLMKQDSYMRFLKSDMYRECMVAEEEDRPLPFEDEVYEHHKNKAVWYLRKSRSSGKDLNETGNKKGGLLNFLSKGKAGKTIGGGDTPRKERSVSTGSVPDYHQRIDLSHLNQLNGQNGSNQTRKGAELWDGLKSKASCSFVRVILPDGTSTMMAAEAGTSIRQSLQELCEYKKMTLTTYDVFVGYEKQTTDLDKDISQLQENVIFLERRVLFRFDLPNNRSVGIKANPHKTLSEVLEPIMRKNGFDVTEYSFYMINSKIPITLDIQISHVENKRLVTRLIPKKPEKENGVLSKPPHPDSSRSSFRKLRSNSFRDDKKYAVRSDETLNRLDRERSSGRKKSFDDVSKSDEKEKLSRKFSNEMRHLLLGRSKSADEDGTQALLVVLQKSQVGRMDDQRGPIPKNLELPDFLKTTSTAGVATSDIRITLASSTHVTTTSSMSNATASTGPMHSSPVHNRQANAHFPASPMIFDDEYGDFRPAAEVLQDTSFQLESDGRPSLYSVRSWRDMPSPDRKIVPDGSPAFPRHIYGNGALTAKLSKSDSVLTGYRSADPVTPPEVFSITPSPELVSNNYLLPKTRLRSPTVANERDVELMNTTDSIVSNRLCAYRSADSIGSSSHGSLSSSGTLNITSLGSRPQLSPDSGFGVSNSTEVAFPQTSTPSLHVDFASSRGRSRPRPISQKDEKEIIRGLEVEGYDVIPHHSDSENTADRTLVAQLPYESPQTPSGSFEVPFPNAPSRNRNDSFPDFTPPSPLEMSDPLSERPVRTSSPVLALRNRLFSSDFAPSSPGASTDSSRRSHSLPPSDRHGSRNVQVVNGVHGQIEERVTFV